MGRGAGLRVSRDGVIATRHRLGEFDASVPTLGRSLVHQSARALGRDHALDHARQEEQKEEQETATQRAVQEKVSILRLDSI